MTQSDLHSKSATPPVLFLLRHGETEWALSGQHTGRTDIPLTEKGRSQATALKALFEKVHFTAVLSSPLGRAKETAHIAGLDELTVDENLAEFDYGEYEGLTTPEIRKTVPGWTVWTHDCPKGETLKQVAARAHKVIEHAKNIGGNVALFSHGHMLRILAATWLNLEPAEGKQLMLDTSTLSILSHERETPAIKIWNAPVNLCHFVDDLF